MPWRTALSTVVGCIMLSASATCETPSEAASTKIEEGMTVEQVASAIGFLPSVVEEMTCGDGDVIPLWACRLQTYADGARTLIVYFRKLDGKPTWQVQSWRVR